MKSVYKTKINIPSYYMDFNKKLSLSALMGIFQDITSTHSDKLKIDRWTLLKTSNAFWVTTKVKLQIMDLPEYSDKITAKTWTIDNTAVKFERDGLISKGKTPLVKIKSEWVALDKDTHKPRAAKTLAFPFGMKNLKTRAIDGKFSNLNYNVSLSDLCYSRIVYSTDIDINHHVNNCYYSKFILDCFNVDYLTQNKLSTYEIHFVNECHEGEKLDFYKIETPDGIFVEGRVEAKSIVKALLKFKI